MSDKKEIKKTTIQGFTYNMWEGEPIIRNYHKISAYIKTRNNLDDKYHYLLATPVFLRSNEMISWMTGSFSTFPPKPLSSLIEQEYNYYKSILDEYLRQYAGVIKQENNHDNIDMLKSALVYSSEDNIFCSDGKIVIVEWGMCPKNTNPIDMMSAYFKGEKDNFRWSSNIEPEIDNSGNDNTEKPEAILNDKHTDFEDIKDDEQFLIDNVSKKETHFSQSKPLINEERRKKYNNTINSENKENNRNKGNNGMYNNTPRSGKNFFKRHWWLWLLLLLLLLLALFLSKCGGGSNKVLPDTPGIMKPITSDDIITSPDSLTKVVANRLNILIKDGGSVVEFAEAFKKVYPQKDYEIVYYDTIIPRVQILFPAEEKEMIREELSNKLPRFTIFIWDESLFENNYVPNDPAMNDSKKRWYFELCKAFEAWNVTQGNPDIIVAIIDDGFDLNHPEFRDKVYKPYNSTTHTNNVYSSSTNHGTHVAGTAIGISDNNVGTSGIAPKCKFMPIQVANSFGLMTSTAIIDGILYAISQGADVANLSLGMSFNDYLQFTPIGYQKSMIINNFLEEEKVWNEIFTMAEANHCTLVLAAGNENVLSGIDPMQRNNLGIKVSAVQPNLKKAEFSNYGDYSTVSAPGIEIYNSTPNNGYAYMQGTSMAAPIVSGAVALFKSKNKNLTTPQIISVLEETGLNSTSYVGKIIQLDEALAAVSGRNYPNNPLNPEKPSVDCTTIAERMKQLQHEIEQLKKQYPDCYNSIVPDTLSFPERKIDISDLQGRWKSTTPLFSEAGEEVSLYFDFNGTNKGKLLLIDTNGIQFQSITTLSINNNKLIIFQDDKTHNSKGKPNYPPYHFTCKPNNRKQAECLGVNTIDGSNKINFKLIKIN